MPARKSVAGKDPRVIAFERNLPEGITPLLLKGHAAIDAGRFVRAVVQQWGGEEKFAESVYQEFLHSKSPQQRAALLGMLMRLVERVSSAEARRPPDYAAIPDDELLATARALLLKVEGRDGQEETGPAKELPPGESAAGDGREDRAAGGDGPPAAAG